MMAEGGMLRVGMAQSEVVIPPMKLACFGVGSCVCVVLYDPQIRLAGLAHAMLPSAPPQGPGVGEEFKYADWATRRLVELMEKKGASRQHLFARLVGGANMFAAATGREAGSEISLGERNLKAARQALRDLGVPLTAEEGGGGVGRSLEFNPDDGSLLVRSAWADQRWL